ncbi:mitochondrial 50S ribosomal protein L27, putative [Pediculus humanus corporis]|uniref:Mitochondrial 50S ribosomal protein L27, putative n=1 Tax=Pediculus humanus subsp. corporis TaxID=121224 RepID=E0VE64_PEDHC|nr:mitochondrial 50S ribosomal protein L27, putative [Pediculus humanus corporis]EEB11670.1 mitochondrial 50S ribosomal protein L27, putative [Pediculus humanus corporis]
MAALLLQLNSCSRKVLSEAYSCCLGSIRYKSKINIPSYRSTYGIKILDSSHVNPNQILVRQRTLEWLPGLNVKISGNGDLLAKVSGKVFITYEKTNLNRENRFVNTNYSDSLPKYKVYFNVIPDPAHQVFKLIDTIWLVC